MKTKTLHLNEEETVRYIVGMVVSKFNCFGGGQRSPWGNPVAEALKDQPPMFAAGVDVEQVVRAVMKELE
jgi:hypothetical protein